MKNEKQADIMVSGRKGIGWTVFFFLVFIICLFYNQWVTLENLSNAINPLSRFGTVSDFLAFLNSYGSRVFTSSDVFVFVLIVFIPVFLVLMEIRAKWLTNLLESLPKKDGTVVLLLVVVSFVCMRYYFAAGSDMYNGDASYFFYCIRETAANFKHFILFPYWSFMHGGGAPFLQFYGPLHPVIGAVLYLITGNLALTAKLTLFLFHVACVIGVYLFIRELSGSRRAGLISAVAAMLMYLHPHLMIFPGRYGESAIWAVYPFLFYFFEKLLKERKIIWSLPVAVSVAFLVFASIGMSFYFFMFFGLYVLLRLLFCGLPVKERLKVLLYAALSGILGLMLCSYYLYGQFVESQWSVAQTFSPHKIGGIEKGIFLPLFLWNNYQISLFKFDFVWQSAYLGISLIILSLIGAAASFRKKDLRFLPLTVLLGAIIFYLVGYGRVGFLMKIPYLHTYTQSRLLNILALMVIFLAGPGAFWLMRKAAWKPRILTVILIVIFIDLFPTTFHDSFGKRYGDTAADFLTQLNSESAQFRPGIPPYRADLIGLGNHRAIKYDWRSLETFIAETGMPIVSETVWDYRRTREFYENFNRLLYLNRINLMDVLIAHYIADCKYILSSVPLPRNAFRSYVQNGDAVLAEMPFLTPVITTSRISNTVFTSNELIPFLRQSGIDMAKGTASHMWVVNGPTTNLGTTPVMAEVLEHTVGRREVKLRIRTVSETFAILSYAAYPTLRVFVNGKPARTFETVYGFLVVKLGAGESTVVLKPSRSRNAAFFFAFSLALFLAVIGIFIFRLAGKKASDKEASA